MLEKIGLPAKPSMRGANWVIDASHCQGCSSQFTMFNRKHHCRRCGGIFCNSCTQQRMVLRGQGDSPVRICDPCKNLEEAARFEQRYGHRNRTAKGNSKQILKTEDELGEFSGADRKESLAMSDISGQGDSSYSFRWQNDALIDSESSSPEDLRQQALEEKKRYRILKAEGKAEEALKAFKHGKELERQAGSLEIAIRKNRRLSGKASSISSRVAEDIMNENETLRSEKKAAFSRNKEVKDDLFSELRQLGWSDADLHEADKKPVKLSLEGEFSNLVGDTFQKSDSGWKKGSVDKTQVVVHKRKALLLKREGKLAEAKEELKQAKILEKQLEEQEVLGTASDSDDELYNLIQNMGNDDQDDRMLENNLHVGTNFEHFRLDGADDNPVDGDLEVTEDDMNDPELRNALRSFGWTEEDEVNEGNDAAKPDSFSREALLAEIIDLKKVALSEKRAGNVPEAMALLKKAKLLEQRLENIQPETEVFSQKSVVNYINAPKSKMAIQKELLVSKKKALTLRREGRLEEADEELKKGKVLEQQLEELENSSKKPVNISSQKCMAPSHAPESELGTYDIGVDGEETEVSERDMHDPAILSALKNLGWDDDEADSRSTANLTSKPLIIHSASDSVPAAMPTKSIRSKAEIQRELLAIKRKALSLRRQGKIEEADGELERAKDLEKQLAELESRSSETLVSHGMHIDDNLTRILDVEGDEKRVSRHTETNKIADDSSRGILVVEGIEKQVSRHAETSKMVDSAKPLEKSSFVGSRVQSLEPAASVLPEPGPNISQKHENSTYITNKANEIKEQILSHKRNALSLKMEGKLIEAKEELRKAKLLEKSVEEEGQEISTDAKPIIISNIGNSSTVQENTITHSQKPISSRDRFKLQQDSLAHKRNALKLRREGKAQEADVEFEKAKKLENQLEELGGQASSGGAVGADAVEDFLDPQLVSALKSIGWDDKDLASKKPEKLQPLLIKKVSDQSYSEMTRLEEEIKATKLRALNFKRAGKQDEALEALRSAKKLEKKLDSMT